VKWFIFAAGIAWGPVGALAWWCAYRLRIFRRAAVRFTTDWLAIAATTVVISAIQRNWFLMSGTVASFVIALIVRWWNRRKRRNAAALIGAKSRALRDALVRKVRESATPRPVLRPVPQGASA